MKRYYRAILLITSGVLFVLLITFALWALIIPAPMAQACAALVSDEQVHVETEPWLVFRLADQEPHVGLILYPGGRVSPQAYSPVARDIAAEGYLVVIVPMPLNLAISDPNRADAVVSAFPEVDHWAIGGHSLGGAMAARYALSNPSSVQGLALWAAYPAADDDLSRSALAVVSVYGTLDGLATVDEIDASRALLPEGTKWVPIAGGNHAHFGWCGPQAGDNPATISRWDQQQKIVAATVTILLQLEEEL